MLLTEISTEGKIFVSIIGVIIGLAILYNIIKYAVKAAIIEVEKQKNSLILKDSTKEDKIIDKKKLSAIEVDITT
jgi:hypothetical protein